MDERAISCKWFAHMGYGKNHPYNLNHFIYIRETEPALYNTWCNEWLVRLSIRTMDSMRFAIVVFLVVEEMCKEYK